MAKSELYDFAVEAGQSTDDEGGEIDVDEGVLGGIDAKCDNGIVSYKCSHLCMQYIRSIVSKLVSPAYNHNSFHLRLRNPSSLHDIRLQGLVKSLYDELSASRFEKLKHGFQVLPHISCPSTFNTGASETDEECGRIPHIMAEIGYANRLENVMFGGTFDRLHYGHKYTILCSFMMAKSHLYLGISKSHQLTADKLYGHLIQPYHERLYNIQKYITDISDLTSTPVKISVFDHYVEPQQLTPRVGQLQIVIFPILSPIFPAEIANSEFVLVVTEDTFKGGRAVNDARKRRGLLPWPLVQLPLVGIPVISSTKLRAPEAVHSI